MRSSLLTCAVVLFLSVSSNASAITVDVTAMTFNSVSYVASGELTSINNGSISNPDYGSATGTLFSSPWSTWAVEYFDDTSGTTLHYDGIDYTTGEDFDYAFTLSEGQVAWGLLVSWNGGNDHPILNIMDCGNGNPGHACTGIGTPMQVNPFLGVEYSYDGVVVSAVPVPAVIWLFGSGLLGLIGVARRKARV